MKLFLYEHITSGALAEQDLPTSLAHEGNQMLLATIRDCHALSQCNITILRDDRLAKINIIDNSSKHHCHSISTQLEYRTLWSSCLNEADAVLIIAPETDGVLADLHLQAEALGKPILGCQTEAIKLTSDKLRCNQQLANHHIPVTVSCLATDWPQHRFESTTGYIIKPVEGAGCLNTLFFDSVIALEQHLSEQQKEAIATMLVQRYVQGIPISLSLLIASDNVLVLAVNLQKIEHQGNALIFNGCTVNGIEQDCFSPSQALQLAQQIRQAIPGLWGFVGIDLILSSDGAVVLDINPRLTSSYIGLKQSLDVNPMALMFALKDQGIVALPAISQRQAITLSL